MIFEMVVRLSIVINALKEALVWQTFFLNRFFMDRSQAQVSSP
ncbi:hypothetical protein RESH_06052 [Rhodopirellula europaea SH398]|jgi:hypothetical protein|uniref:Uncharacterized protein n=1 Tax=Rhodopirellula europaea SH398 TaxID=1263868 RepID=M5SB40_9BACT|nr:hypothetical protein RESH_06052 [Rhodopirellula europaea SH398]